MTITKARPAHQGARGGLLTWLQARGCPAVHALLIHRQNADDSHALAPNYVDVTLRYASGILVTTSDDNFSVTRRLALLLWSFKLYMLYVVHWYLNPLTGTSKPQSNTVIGTLAVDGWACIWYSEEGTGRPAAPLFPPRCRPTKCNSHPLTVSVPT